MSPFVLFFFGPPGSGKSTQAERVAAKFNAAHLDTGGLLREIFNDPLRQSDPKIQEEKIKHEIQGQLNDSIWVAGLVIEEVRRLHAKGNSIVSSGFPRSIFEAEVELPVLRDMYGDRLFVIDLEVSEATTLRRNTSRRICPQCHKIYSSLLEGGIPETCTVCGEKLELRSDDNPEVVKHRLDVYKERTLPLLEYFAQTKVQKVIIDGEPSPNVVFESIVSVLTELL